MNCKGTTQSGCVLRLPCVSCLRILRSRDPTIARQAGVKKLVLTHFRPMSEAMVQSIAEDVAHDFDGPVVLGTDLTEVLV